MTQKPHRVLCKCCPRFAAPSGMFPTYMTKCWLRISYHSLLTGRGIRDCTGVSLLAGKLKNLGRSVASTTGCVVAPTAARCRDVSLGSAAFYQKPRDIPRVLRHHHRDCFCTRCFQGGGVGAVGERRHLKQPVCGWVPPQGSECFPVLGLACVPPSGCSQHQGLDTTSAGLLPWESAISQCFYYLKCPDEATLMDVSSSWHNDF